VILVRLFQFFAEEARIPVSHHDERAGRGGYVISDHALMQANFDFNFTAKILVVDTVLDEV